MSERLDQTLLNELQEIMEDEFPLLLETYLSESKSQHMAVTESWAGGDLPALHRAAHALKGSCANVGAQVCASLCQQIESAASQNTTDGIEGAVAALSGELDSVRAELSERLI